MDAKIAVRVNGGKLAMTEIVVASAFGKALGGRYEKDGPKSGEEFRRDHLIPAVREASRDNGKVVVNFDGVSGMPTSFLEESFGGLIRALTDVPSPRLLGIIEIVAPNSPRLWQFCSLARDYMQSAAARRGK